MYEVSWLRVGASGSMNARVPDDWENLAKASMRIDGAL